MPTRELLLLEPPSMDGRVRMDDVSLEVKWTGAALALLCVRCQRTPELANQGLFYMAAIDVTRVHHATEAQLHRANLAECEPLPTRCWAPARARRFRARVRRTWWCSRRQTVSWLRRPRR